MTSDRRLWDAITAATGMAVVATLEDLLGALLFLQRYAGFPVPANPSVMAVGVGGGASVLAADACDRAGLEVTRIRPDIIGRLREMGYGVGMSVVNPLEVGVGPKASPNAFNRVLDAILPDQPFPDVLLHVNIQSYYSYDTGGLQQLLAMMEVLGRSDWPATRLVLVARNLDAAPGTDVDVFYEAAEAARLPVYRNFDEAVTAIAIGKHYGGNS
jgi:acyl-CoA synthetase (NDP forming)